MSHDTNRHHRPDHWVYLDRSWAKRLGVKRTAGTYRIRSRDLVRRAFLENLGVDASGTICVRGAASGSETTRTQVIMCSDDHVLSDLVRTDDSDITFYQTG